MTYHQACRTTGSSPNEPRAVSYLRTIMSASRTVFAGERYDARLTRLTASAGEERGWAVLENGVPASQGTWDATGCAARVVNSVCTTIFASLRESSAVHDAPQRSREVVVGDGPASERRVRGPTSTASGRAEGRSNSTGRAGASIM